MEQQAMHSLLLDYEAQCWKELERLKSKFKKDAAARKTKDYLKIKQKKLHNH
jgi:hypothetical protein